MTRALDLDDIKHLLLDMLSTTRPVDADHIAALGETGWQTLCNMAAQHRLGPMLHVQCKARGASWNAPAAVRERWAATYRHSAIRSLSIRQGLIKLDGLLNAASTPYAALKGAWLSLHAYPHPALRPMRDIDIIVPVDQALPVFKMLIELGYSRKSGEVMPLEHALEKHKHLPPLSCPVSNCSIEVHSRLIGEIPEGNLSETIADTAALLLRGIHEISEGNMVSFLSPTDTLLHLIVHSAYEHRFNNGPLVINDIAAILLTCEIECDRFWTMAKAGNWTRGCQLLFAMTKVYHDNKELPVCNDGVAQFNPALVDSAALLMLIDFDEFRAVSFRRQLLGGFRSRKSISDFLSKAVPERFVIASLAGLPLSSKWVWAHYPVWLWTRCRQIIFRMLGSDLHQDAKRATQIEKWLAAKE